MNRKDGDPFISRMQGYASEPCGSFFIVIL
uniref:Uncharacterized protein n=1 Tax=virus sp. ctEfN2 TaxID=2825810 RepID=A0A8S5RN11_9VIRU|nr:MAG TPA: hypothetical protein [virus sp. ctEfN2]